MRVLGGVYERERSSTLVSIITDYALSPVVLNPRAALDAVSFLMVRIVL